MIAPKLSPSPLLFSMLSKKPSRCRTCITQRIVKAGRREATLLEFLYLHQGILQVKASAEQWGVHCSKGQQALNEKRERYLECGTVSQNCTSISHLHLLPPWLPSDTQSPLLQLRQRDQPQSLDDSEIVLLFSVIHSSSEWYLMILEDISKLVRHSSDLKIFSRTRR